MTKNLLFQAEGTNDRKKIFFYLTKRGLCSEIITLIYTIAYAELHHFQLLVDDQSWNARYKNGWLDYFASNKYFNINNSRNRIFTEKFQLKKISDIKLFLDYLYVVYSLKTKNQVQPQKGIKKFLKPFYKYFSEFLKPKSFSHEIHLMGNYLHRYNTESGRVWEEILNIANQEEILSRKKLHPNLSQFLSKIAVEIWQPHAKVLQKEIPQSNYISLHIRRGDKLREEAKEVQVEYFIKLIEENNWENELIFISTDDYSVISEFKDKKPDWTIITFTTDNSQGHEQAIFNQRSPKEINASTNEFLNEIEIHIRSMVYIGSITSNVTKLISLIRNDRSNTFSVDRLENSVYDIFYQKA